MINDYLAEIEKCIACKKCEVACPIFAATGHPLDTPHQRLQIAKRILKEEKISPEEYRSIYNCPKCEKCQVICSSEIKLVKIIGKAREELFNQGYELLPGHQGLRNGILKMKNSVKGDPTKLLDYLPVDIEFDEAATTIYYAGCLPGYFLKAIAKSSIQILNKINIPFKVLENEICCGSPLIDLGDLSSAEQFFTENLTIFNKSGVKELIVSCSGCYRCFTEFYPEVLGKSLKVTHIVDVIAAALKEGKIEFKQLNRKVLYHDPCHLSREFGKYTSPRDVLKTSSELLEFTNNREAADCCGANSAVRAGFKDLSMQVALARVDQAIGKADTIVSSCPFCTFNFSYACRKNNRDLKINYITEFLLDAI